MDGNGGSAEVKASGHGLPSGCGWFEKRSAASICRDSVCGLGRGAGDWVYRLERYIPQQPYPSPPPRNGYERIPYSLSDASGSIHAIPGSRQWALADSVGARGTCRQRVGRPSLVLAAGVDEAASARGADLHRRRRSGWVQREDPVDVSRAIGEVAGRTKPRGTGPPAGWISDFPATAILHNRLCGPAGRAVVRLRHQHPAYRLLATGSEESRAQRPHPVSSRARTRLG